jgi:uncharacterized protein (DUF2384 family)
MLYDYLGFPDGTLGGLRWHDKVLSGFPYRSVLALSHALALKPADLMPYLGDPDAPLGRRLSVHQSEAALRIALALHRLCAALPDKDSAAEELQRPQAQLGGEPPLRLLQSAAGTALVMGWIGRLHRVKPLPAPVMSQDGDEAEDAAEAE